MPYLWVLTSLLCPQNSASLPSCLPLSLQPNFIHTSVNDLLRTLSSHQTTSALLNRIHKLLADRDSKSCMLLTEFLLTWHHILGQTQHSLEKKKYFGPTLCIWGFGWCIGLCIHFDSLKCEHSFIWIYIMVYIPDWAFWFIFLYQAFLNKSFLINMFCV